MNLEKRMKMELRDITQKKQVAQLEYTNLLAEVGLLNEQKSSLLTSNEFERQKHQQFLSTCKQEVDFLRQEKETTDTLINNLKAEIAELEAKKETFTSEIAYFKNEHENALQKTINAKNNARQALDTLETVEQNLGTKKNEEYELSLAFKFLQGKISFLESECNEIKAKIEEEKGVLQSIIKEQSRHSDWDQYLQAKENFLIEQFKLLGVKYVVYNSR